MPQYRVKLVAVSGREQPVLLQVDREGLLLLTEGGKEIQKLPYHNVVKWLPSSLRTKDPGGPDCMDVQVETSGGKKDLRMRCESPATVELLMQEIRTTVQAIMRELTPGKSPLAIVTHSNAPSGAGAFEPGSPSSPLRQGLATLNARARQSRSSMGDAGALSPPTSPFAAPPQQMWKDPPASTPAPLAAVTAPDPVGKGDCTTSSPRGSQPAAPAATVTAAAPPNLQGGQSLDTAATMITIPTPRSSEQGVAADEAAVDAAQGLGTAGVQQQQPSSRSEQAPSPAALPAAADGPKAALPGAWEASAAEAVTSEPAAAGSSGGGWRIASHPGETAEAGAPLSPGGSAASSLRQLLGRPAAQRPFPPLPPAPGGASKETDIWAGSPRSGAQPRVDLSQLGLARGSWPSPAAAAGGGSAGLGAFALQAQVEFLEDIVRRLSVELACTQQQQAPRSPDKACAPLPAASSLTNLLALLPEGAPLPPWLKEPRQLSPLLAAYDRRVAVLEAALGARKEGLQGIQAEVEALASENSTLHSQLAKQATLLEARRLQACAGAGAGVEHVRLQEQVELLTQENDLLIQQQGAMEEEVVRLHRRLHERGQELALAVAEGAAAAERLHDLARTEKAAKKAAIALKQSKERCKELEAQLAATQGAVAEERARSEMVARTGSELLQRNQLLLEQLAEFRAAGQEQDGMRADLAHARTSASEAASGGDAARRESEALRGALRAVEGRLVEYQRKDAEVYARIREAMEAAEEARLQRDATLAAHDALAADNAALSARLVDALQLQATGPGGLAGLHAALAEREAALGEVLARSQETASQLTALRGVHERLQRDKGSLEAELAALREDFTRPGGSSGRGAGGAGSEQSSREALAEAEVKLDETKQQLESERRAAARATREWQLDRQRLEADLSSLHKRTADAEAAASEAHGAMLAAQQAAAAADAELAAVRAAAGGGSITQQQQLADVLAERDAAVAALEVKLERALESCNSSVTDAQRMLAAKEQLLSKWRSEAHALAAKLEQTQGERHQEASARATELEALRMRCSELDAVNAGLEEQIEQLRGSRQELLCLMEEAEAGGAQREEALMQELHALHSQLNVLQLERSRAERGQQRLVHKLGTLAPVVAPADAAVGGEGGADQQVAAAAGAAQAAS